MGFRQTAKHRVGKHSYHPLGLVRGQFGDSPEREFLAFLTEAGFDGWEESSWLVDLGRCGDDESAAKYARQRIKLASQRGLEIFSLSVHLQGQALGDEPSAKTLAFVGGEAVEAYRAWRAAGNEPPREDPFHVPAEVGRLIHAAALDSMLRAARLAHFLGREQGRRVPLPGFTGSPARAWSHWFQFPPLPSAIGGCPIPDVRARSLELLLERFAPFLEACRRYGVTFDLECHPGEVAFGDLESAREYLDAMDRAGFGDVAGFNLDASHMVWQGVSPIDFIREFGERIHCAHLKGVQVLPPPTRAGLLGGHRPMGDRFNGWNFVTAGCARDATRVEEIIIELNRAGFEGALTIEWEDNDVERFAGARAALEHVRKADLPPSAMRHDDALKA
jgi:sugar phosphate isomerase/epimerase